MSGWGGGWGGGMGGWGGPQMMFDSLSQRGPAPQEKK
jgi:hypothetical protein